MFTATLFTIAKILKQLKCPSIDKWIRRVVYTYDRLLLSHKKVWNLAICDSMDWPGGFYVKWNKWDRERKIPYDFTHMVESK